MKSTIAIIALVQNTSAIQLKDQEQFVNLVQADPMDELGLLGSHSGGNPEMGELGGTGTGGMSGTGADPMDELGLGPP